MWEKKKHPLKASRGYKLPGKITTKLYLHLCPKPNEAERILADKYYKELKKKLIQVLLGLVHPIFYGLKKSLSIKPDTFDKYI